MASDNSAAVGQGSRPSQRTTRESIERSGYTVARACARSHGDTGVHRCLTFTQRSRVAQIMETHKRVTHKKKWFHDHLHLRLLGAYLVSGHEIRLGSQPRLAPSPRPPAPSLAHPRSADVPIPPVAPRITRPPALSRHGMRTAIALLRPPPRAASPSTRPALARPPGARALLPPTPTPAHTARHHALRSVPHASSHSPTRTSTRSRRRTRLQTRVAQQPASRDGGGRGTPPH